MAGIIPAAGGAWKKVADTTLSSPATEISVTGLNLDTHGVYKILFYGFSGATGSSVSWSVNGDTSTGNYRYQRINASSTTVNTNPISSNLLIPGLEANEEVVLEMTLTKKAGVVPRGLAIATYSGASAMTLRIFSVAYTDTSNITSFKVVAGVTNGLAAGSRLIIHKLA
jgi:hypothetical protein